MTMVKLMNVHELVEIARGAGILLGQLKPDDLERENLYVYATDDVHAHSLYVGQSTDRSRAVAESNVIGQGYRERIGVGFSALIVENNATRHSFRYDPRTFDASRLIQHIETFNWHGDPITALRESLEERPTLTVAEVEQILIRIHVCTGRLIGNSQFASQWAGNGIYRVPNVVALLAADIARESGNVHLLSDEAVEHSLMAEGIVRA